MLKLVVSPALVGTVGPKVVVDLPGVEHLEVDALLVDSTVLEVGVDILVLVAIGKRMDCRVVPLLEGLAGCLSQ